MKENINHWLTTSLASYPLLEKDNEVALINAYKEQGDLTARDKLIMSNMRLVLSISNKYAWLGVPLDDLVQVGVLGLMKALDKYDNTKDTRFGTYAYLWVKAEMREHIIDNFSITKIKKNNSQFKLFFNLRGMKEGLDWLKQKEADNIAADLRVSAKEVLEMEKRLIQKDIAFESPSDEDGNQSPATYLEDERYDPAQLIEAYDWERNQNIRLQGAMSKLDERSQDIVQQRWLNEEKATLHELAAKYGVSTERIRQVEMDAMRKLKASLRTNLSIN